MLELTFEELKKLKTYKKKNDVHNDVADLTEKILYLYEEMLFFAQKSHDKELFKQIDFQGFYSQAEEGDDSNYFNYAEFLIFNLNKFPVLKSTTQCQTIKFDIWQTIPTYKEQLRVWEQHGEPNSDEMTKEIVLDILKN